MFAIKLPSTFKLILPSAAGIETLEVPFAMPEVSMPVN